MINSMNYAIGSYGVSRYDGVCSSVYVVMKHKPELVDPRFVDLILSSASYQNYAQSFGTGILDHRRAIGWDEIKVIRIPLPPREEQAKIAEWTACSLSRIDALVAKKTRFIELLREEIVSLATHCQVADDTRWVRLRHVSEAVFRPVDMVAGEDFTRLGLYNRGRGIFKKNAAESDDMGDSRFHWVEDGDLILSGQFAWEGAIAMAGKEHGGCVVSHRYPIIRGRAGGALSEYLYAYLLTTHGDMVLNDSSRGSAGRNRPLNMGLLMNWKIPVPPMDVQIRIASLLLRKQRAVALQKRSIALLKEHRTALITAAVTGKIDLRDAA